MKELRQEDINHRVWEFLLYSLVNVLTYVCWHELDVIRDDTINAQDYVVYTVLALEPGHVGSNWLHHLVDRNLGQEAKLVNSK